MSLPQIQFELTGLPARLAGRARTFTEGRTITSLAGPEITRSLSCSADVLQPRSIGSNFEHSMSSGRDAFLGHACVSLAGVEDHSTPDGSDECSSAVAQIRKGKPGR